MLKLKRTFWETMTTIWRKLSELVGAGYSEHGHMLAAGIKVSFLVFGWLQVIVQAWYGHMMVGNLLIGLRISGRPIRRIILEVTMRTGWLITEP